MTHPDTKSNSYGRLGFGLSQGDGGHGPYTLDLTGDSLEQVTLTLTEAQGLLLPADLVEFGSRVLRREIEKTLFHPQAR